MAGPRSGVREHHWLDRDAIGNGVVDRPALVLSAVSVIVALSAQGSGVAEADNLRAGISRGQEEGRSPALLVPQSVAGLAPLAVLGVAV